jgi:hypothetical protein
MQQMVLHPGPQGNGLGPAPIGRRLGSARSHQAVTNKHETPFRTTKHVAGACFTDRAAEVDVERVAWIPRLLPHR